MAYLLVLSAFLLLVNTIPSTTAVTVYTMQSCNYTAYPKGGCEDDIGAECVENRCRCKPDHDILYDGRFCFRKSCSPGQYYDEYMNSCLDQRRASSMVADSHCRYDYHCYGSHVRCKLHGWNRNCVCEPGFVYGYNGTCIPLHGIGGHCQRDTDCDATGHRKMLCEAAKDTTKPGSSGTCQCIGDHTYNYQVDGCESNEQIRERRRSFRTLILLFIVAGIVFGFALTFNFGFFGIGNSRHQQAMLLKRFAEEKARHERQKKEAEEGAKAEAPSAPPVEGTDSVGPRNATDFIDEVVVVDLETPKKGGADKSRLIAL